MSRKFLDKSDLVNILQKSLSRILHKSCKTEAPCDIVLYCIVRPYIEGRLDRYRIGITLRSMSPQETHLLIARRRNSITSALVYHIMNDRLKCYL